MTKEEAEKAQTSLDEQRKLMEQSVAYEEQLKKEIAESSPYISDLMDLSVLKQEYATNKFENCFEVLYQKYKRVRRLRRDGNCFYRAYLFQLFEHLILNDDKTYYKKLIDIIEKSKEDLMINAGYDEIVIEDFYDTFLDTLKKLAEIEKKNAQEHIMSLLCTSELANYLIMYIRFLAACYLKKNAILYEGFVGDVSDYCSREVEQLDVEADHLPMIALNSYLELGVEINSVDNNGTI